MLPEDGTPSPLNPGDVQVMARIRLNGKPCGIAWKSPFRLDITNALTPRNNTLEIDIANRWTGFELIVVFDSISAIE
jgi:hypothetical protein